MIRTVNNTNNDADLRPKNELGNAKIALRFNVHRLLTFGLIESLQIALLELSGKGSGEKEPILFDEVRIWPAGFSANIHRFPFQTLNIFQVSNLSTHSFTENIDPLHSHIDDLQV